MDKLAKGADEFSVLAELVAPNGINTAGPFAEPAFERLRHALADAQATSLDKAILLRQVLRHESLRRGSSVSLRIDPQRIPAESLTSVGCAIQSLISGSIRVEAQPWQPNWLADDQSPVDSVAMRAEQRRFHADTLLLGDPFLEAIGLQNYRSLGQRAAVRAAITMPPGAKLIVDLPTGEGKSAVFRVINRVGFASDAVGTRQGVTLVIVPTVTLAYDQERVCGGTPDKPLAYVGGREPQNGLIRAAIRSGTQGLCFAAPEAALGPLSPALREAAQNGLLRAVVIDEAHLVESWGTSFRTEFQTFASQTRQWLDLLSPDARFRTLFLSATLSESARQTLVDLFEPGGDIPVVSGAKVRPEPDYWLTRPSDPNVRDGRVLEALMRLPRAAILYVTKVNDAIIWFDRLKNAGYGRVAMVHGKTPNEERERILQQWARSELDLVVATSAFGLGVDYAHVRTVIHACIPESFDRFYQEVGRAGRDGCATISLLLPTPEDFRTAEGLSQRPVISVDRGLQRWRAMFTHPDVVKLGHPRYSIRLDVAPGHTAEDIDLIGDRSTDWNARLLVLMARSGLIRVLGPTPRPPKEHCGPWFDIEVQDDGHLSEQRWTEKTEPKRLEIAKGARLSLSLMERFLSGNECPGRLAAELYGSESRTVALHCSSCSLCRRDPKSRCEEGTVAERPSLWPMTARPSEALFNLAGSNNIAVVELPQSQPTKQLVRDFTDCMKRLDRLGARLFISVGGNASHWLVDGAFKAVRGRPWLFIESSGYAPATWPRGARLIYFDASIPLQKHWLTSARADSPTIAFIPAGLTLADQPHRSLSHLLPGRVLSLGSYIEEVLA
ncbi:MAG TPA: protein DpdF [Burkholderiales bacterium]|nr:protein DpdF [Burkholderiales bacterium]